MPPVDRNNPKRAASSDSQLAVLEFFKEFPDDETCLNWLWRSRFSPDGEHAHCSRCDRERSFRRYKGQRTRQVWKCTSCTQELSPTAGTIFHKSSTSLQLWFYAMFIMSSTRCGVSAKQLERELGVTYKTAWRMFNLIRNKLMVQDDNEGGLKGEVEVDETWIGGRMRHSDRRKAEARGITLGPHAKKRETVFAMVERGGKVRAIHIPSRYGYTMRSTIRRHVDTNATIYTDDYKGYNGVERVYTHHRINHSHRVYVDGAVHTQTIEGFFSLVKNGIRGVYHSVSPKWLPSYLNEYAWRYNHRDDQRAMFRLLLDRAATV
jgi:transposase